MNLLPLPSPRLDQFLKLSGNLIANPDNMVGKAFHLSNGVSFILLDHDEVQSISWCALSYISYLGGSLLANNSLNVI